MKKFSRMEANKEVRRVLNKFHVDLTNCQYSAAGREIRMSGYLCKLDSSEFGSMHVEGMIQEFMRRLPGYMINGDFDNWKFTSDHITRLDKNSEEQAPVYFADDDDQDSEAS